jgi:HEAT repeat protein
MRELASTLVEPWLSHGTVKPGPRPAEDARVRQATADLLGSLGQYASAHTDALAALLADRFSYVRHAAAALASIGPKALKGAARATAEIAGRLRHTDRGVRLVAAELLGEHLCPRR